MKILVINPNTSASMTEQMRASLEPVKRADTRLEVVRAPTGPDTIESGYDEAYAIPPTLELVKIACENGFDAVIIACFCDPGLRAARECATIPVFGIEETSLHIAAMLGAGFSIMTPRSARISTKRQEVLAYGLKERLVSIHALDLDTAETTTNPNLTKDRLVEKTREAIELGAEVIVLGCAGMTGYAGHVQQETGVVVIDPTAVTLKVAEGLVDLGLSHSKLGMFHSPPLKPFR